ncbi:MAG: hypothetical protein ABSG32_14555 [Terriglobia bacterium]|jgi:hypothetical protein
MERGTLYGHSAYAALGQTGIGGVAAMKATRLQCDYAENPLGIDVRKPRLSWELEAVRRGSRQFEICTGLDASPR